MPGKPFRSSLEPHFDEIAQRRARRGTWQGIAAELEKAHKLKVHFSAVQKFFGRYQARRVQPLGFAPQPATESTRVATVSPSAAPETVVEEHQGYGEPAHPDDENPFLMRQRQSPSSARTPATSEPAAEGDASAKSTPAKKYVFIPKPKAPNRFSNEDLEFNDPLA